MKYLIFTSKNEAIERNMLAFNAGVGQGMLTNAIEYSGIVQHPFRTEFALQIDPRFADLFTPEENVAAVELAKDWFRHGIIDGQFIIEQPISNYHKDATVARRVFCNIPEISTTEPETFSLRVIIRHYRDGEHIFEELADFEDFLRAVDDEFRQFYGLIEQGANMLELIRGNIMLMDGAGRFNQY